MAKRIRVEKENKLYKKFNGCVHYCKKKERYGKKIDLERGGKEEGKI